MNTTTIYSVEGMTCMGCVAHVKKAIEANKIRYQEDEEVKKFINMLKILDKDNKNYLHFCEKFIVINVVILFAHDVSSLKIGSVPHSPHIKSFYFYNLS